MVMFPRPKPSAFGRFHKGKNADDFCKKFCRLTKEEKAELNKGDMVMHAAFGRGMVLSVMKMGGDALLEIAFDDIGTKKLMAKSAAAHLKHL